RPTHPPLDALEVGLRGARSEYQSGVAGVQMIEMGNVVGDHGAAAAAMLGPAFCAGLNEGAVDDQLATTLKEAQQVDLAVGSVEYVFRIHGQPRHPASLRA